MSNEVKKWKYWGVGFGYLFVVIAHLGALLWYASGVYLPPVGYYQFYPIAVLVGALMNIVVHDEFDWWSYLAMMIGFFGWLFAIFTLVPLVGNTDFQTSSFTGSWYYANNGGGGHVKVTSANNLTMTGGVIPNGYSYFYLTMTCLNLIFGFLMFWWCVSEVWTDCLEGTYKRVVDENDVDKGPARWCIEPGTSKIELFIQWWCLIWVVFGGVSHIMISFFIFVQQFLPISIFTNPLMWNYTLLMMGTRPPMAVISGIKENAPVRYILKTPFLAIVWLVGLFLAVVFNITTLVETRIWRGENGMTLCPQFSQGYGVDLVYFPDSLNYTKQVVRYDLVNLGGSQDLQNQLTWYVEFFTCYDDLLNILFLCATLVVFITGVVLYSYPETQEAKLALKIRKDFKNNSRKEELKEENEIINKFPVGGPQYTEVPVVSTPKSKMVVEL
jgi:hypothetical protein